jgi:hypothetical protein
MAPPNKRQRQLRQLQEEHRAKRAYIQADNELLDDTEPMGAIETQFFFADMIATDDTTIERRMSELLRWKPGAGSHLRSVYTGNSRTTAYRHRLQAEKLQRSSAGCMTIDNFFPRTVSSPSQASIEAPIKLAIQTLESYNLGSNNQADQSIYKVGFTPFKSFR